MKNKTAIFSMIARHSFYKVLAILAGLVAANAAVFCVELNPGFTDLQTVYDAGPVIAIFLAAFALMSLVLCTALCDRSGHQNYFLDRLRISSRVLYSNHMLYNAMCYALLFAVEAVTLLGLGLLAAQRYPELFNHQSLMLACYESDVLHTFFPLSDVVGWVTNGMLILALGICTAALPIRNRHGKKSITTFFACGTAALYCYVQSDNQALYVDVKLLAIGMAALCILISLCGTWFMEVDEDV